MADEAPRRPRELVGAEFGWSGRSLVYLTDDAVEVDERDGYDIIRSRVYLDDVLMVTHHRYHGIAALSVLGVGALLSAWITLTVAQHEPEAGLVVGLIVFAPFAVGFLVRLILGVDRVAVFGRRTSASMRYGFRKRRAREVFEKIASRVRDAQAALASAIAREEALSAAPLALQGETVPPPPEIEVRGAGEA